MFLPPCSCFFSFQVTDQISGLGAWWQLKIFSFCCLARVSFPTKSIPSRDFPYHQHSAGWRFLIRLMLAFPMIVTSCEYYPGSLASVLHWNCTRSQKILNENLLLLYQFQNRGGRVDNRDNKQNKTKLISQNLACGVCTLEMWDNLDHLCDLFS